MSDNKWSANRRRFVKTAGAAGVVGLAGCSGDDGGDGENGNGSDGGTAGSSDSSTTEVTWVMNPAEEEIDIQVQYQPLFEYIESEADVEIIEQPTASYSGTAQELRRAGEGDRVFADTSPGAVAQIPEEINVTGMRVAYGAEKYFSLITTRADSDIEELSDLEGEVVASAAPTSVSGTLFPLLMLSNAGLDIGEAPSSSPEAFELRTSDHSTAREQLIQDDRIAAAGTGAFSTAAHVPQEQFDEMSQEFVDISAEYDGAGEDDPELRLLAVSDPIPRAPIVSNAAWEESLKDEIRQLMIDAPQEAFEHESQADIAEELNIDPEILDMDESELSDAQQDELNLVEAHALWFSGVVEASTSDYDPVAELGQELGLEWGDL
ncbi:phosphate/phosphonate ABC transporter substrate-binding protein [Halorubrum aidingense JCM 13560]|uniref:Phosphate/phosphonate ABC transporter substrate-binding protein n=1 Tax=Halorubrum aidingense JCM 13560 TaxID=1230454 RepID=M0P5J5_9EURY|nr:PhnD/SsuA/transferrin family substrate-binding protein [Halorubrum aidingense]EMA65341.1 phosphate/phosphonate ABC transporter substrate-binding protein [Halorubrum aidingense JCM 13560]